MQSSLQSMRGISQVSLCFWQVSYNPGCLLPHKLQAHITPSHTPLITRLDNCYLFPRQHLQVVSKWLNTFPCSSAQVWSCCSKPRNPQILTILPWVKKALLFQCFCQINLPPLTPTWASWTFFSPGTPQCQASRQQWPNLLLFFLFKFMNLHLSENFWALTHRLRTTPSILRRCCFMI